MELADRHNLDEYRLRPVLQLPQQAHAEMVQQIIQFNLNGRQVREICESGDEQPNNDEEQKHVTSYARGFVKVNAETNRRR